MNARLATPRASRCDLASSTRLMATSTAAVGGVPERTEQQRDVIVLGLGFDREHDLDTWVEHRLTRGSQVAARVEDHAVGAADQRTWCEKIRGAPVLVRAAFGQSLPAVRVFALQAQHEARGWFA